MALLPEHLIRIFLNEAFYYRKAIVGIFVTISVAFAVVGLLWPKGYSVHTTILVDQRNIIQPLMQGAAVATEVNDRSRLAREVIFGRKIMDQILHDAGWLANNPAPDEQEKIIQQVVRRTTITNLGQNLIRIEYKDEDPERAYTTAKRFAELFIAESIGAKTAESHAAFEFIDKQVSEYHEKLTKAEESLREFRSDNLDAQPGLEADVSARLNALQTRIEEATRELRETEIRKTSLEKQLSGEAETAFAVSRESQYRSRIADLQSQLENLRLSYHETYPDIVRLRHQIDDLNQAIAAERQRREQAKATGQTVVDETVVNNPMYQQLRRELSQAQVQIDTLTARIQQARQQLQSELERGRRMQGGATALAELTRDYQVNREIYQDLLRRRENARVSMNLDRDNQGLTFKVQEPASLPLQPTGLRVWHFVVGGLILGILTPFGLLYGKLQVDPRLRIATVITEVHKLPLLGTVPQLWSPAETAAVRRDTQKLALLTAVTVVLILGFMLLRLVRIF